MPLTRWNEFCRVERRHNAGQGTDLHVGRSSIRCPRPLHLCSRAGTRHGRAGLLYARTVTTSRDPTLRDNDQVARRSIEGSVSCPHRHQTVLLFLLIALGLFWLLALPLCPLRRCQERCARECVGDDCQFRGLTEALHVLAPGCRLGSGAAIELGLTRTGLHRCRRTSSPSAPRRGR